LLAQRRALEAALRPPPAVEEADPAERGDVEDVVAALRLDRLVDVAQGKVEGSAEAILDQLGRAQRRHGVGRAGAASQEGLGAPLPQPVAERLDVRDQARMSAVLGAHQHCGQGLPGEQLLLAPLERAEARDQPGLGGKGREQALGEGMDGLDPEPAAGRVEDPGEQAARPRPRFRPEILAQRLQLGGKLAVSQPHPISQPPMDPVRHLRRSRLGEGEAQDRGRLGAGEEQAKHPGSEDVSLARSG
jgi:hypothetical protein